MPLMFFLISADWLNLEYFSYFLKKLNLNEYHKKSFLSLDNFKNSWQLYTKI